MQNRLHNKYNTEDYLLLGRIDAWKEDIVKEKIINEIKISKYDFKEKLERIKNYLIGYKIGKLEILLSKCEDLVCFNFYMKEFSKLTETEIINTPFKKGYETFQKEAKKEARKLLKNKKNI